MNRRQVLAQIGAGGIISIAGCIGGAESPGTADDQTKSDPELIPSTTATDDSNPVLPALSDQPCPPYETSRDRAACSHTVDPVAAPVYLAADPVRTELDSGAPAEEITLTIHNQSTTELTFNPHSWSVWHNADTTWTELEQQLSGDGKLTLAPNETHSWSFTGAVESIQENPTFESGLYAAELGVPTAENSSKWIACIALVQLGADR